MAITAIARRRAREVCPEGRYHEAWRSGVLSAVNSLRHFAEIEGDPAGKEALRRAADALESVHRPSR